MLRQERFHSCFVQASKNTRRVYIYSTSTPINLEKESKQLPFFNKALKLEVTFIDFK